MVLAAQDSPPRVGLAILPYNDGPAVLVACTRPKGKRGKKAVTFGSVVCITADNFQTVMWAEVARCGRFIRLLSVVSTVNGHYPLFTFY